MGELSGYVDAFNIFNIYAKKSFKRRKKLLRRKILFTCQVQCILLYLTVYYRVFIFFFCFCVYLFLIFFLYFFFFYSFFFILLLYFCRLCFNRGFNNIKNYVCIKCTYGTYIVYMCVQLVLGKVSNGQKKMCNIKLSRSPAACTNSDIHFFYFASFTSSSSVISAYITICL